MKNAEFVQQINASLAIIDGGSLRIWGQWFGRPYDNTHQIVIASLVSDHVTLSFDQGETLAVWNPEGLEIKTGTFKVNQAGRVRLEWYDYGRPQTPANLYYQDYVNQGNQIATTTNVDWYTPYLNPDLRMRAIELVSIGEQYISAHRHSNRHREEVLASESCGCFCCVKVFQPETITEWTDASEDRGQTALCPFCGIDSVLGSASGFPITEAFLAQMEQHWFGLR